MKKQNYIKTTGLVAGLILTAATQTQAQRGPIRGQEGRPGPVEERLAEYISGFQDRFEILAAADTNRDRVLDADEQVALAEFIATEGLGRMQERREGPPPEKRGPRSGRGGPRPGARGGDVNESAPETRGPRGDRGPRPDREPPSPEEIAERLAQLYSHYAVYDVNVNGALDSGEIEALITMIREGEEVPPFAFFRPDQEAEDDGERHQRPRRGPRGARDQSISEEPNDAPRGPGRRIPGGRGGA